MKESLREVETEGKTVQEAVAKALKELKAKRNQVSIEILCEEEKGLFGMPGAKSAKVRVTLTKEQKNS
jgi:spoIIIJ-associated protein